jgi:hypothetical protein
MSFKILTIILSVKIVLTLRVKLPCPKCKILIVREILVFNDELLSYFQVEAPIHCPSFFLFFSLTIKDKTKISLTIKI